MTQRRRLSNRSDFNHSTEQIIVKMLHWTLVVLMVFQQLKTTAAVKFKDDTCFTKKKPGLCKEWSDCPIIKTLIDNGEYTNQEVVNCGFGVKEELICCPVGIDVKNETTTPAYEDRSGDVFTTTTTQTPKKDFWLDLLENTTSSTTAKPDFWLDLLTTTTTTTPKPLIVGTQKLNQSLEFYDLNALLASKNKNQPLTMPVQSPPSNQAGIPQNENFHGNNFNADEEIPNNFQNGVNNVVSFNPDRAQFAGNGNGHHFGWGQQNNARGGPMQGNMNFNRGHHNMGRGPHNFNNNGQARNGWAWGNQNQAFTLPQPSMRSNNFFGQHNGPPHHNPGRPVNNMQEQNPNLPVFQKQNLPALQPANTNRPQPVLWLRPQSNNNHHNNHEVEFIQYPTLNQPQQQFINPQVHRHFDFVTPAVNNNDLEAAPSTNFIQQPVVIQTWSTAPTPGSDPVLVVYQNLANSGMDITKAQENQLPNPFLTQSGQVVVVQQPQQRPAQPFIQLQQSESAVKEARSTSNLPETRPLFNVQSPPRQVLNPFKPFEFRPPTAEEDKFSEDNNSLSSSNTQPDSKPDTERPAVRACNIIVRGLNGSLSDHILGGTPAELGEFPHMVALGYSRIGGGNRPPYDIRCGGTLIAKRFVVTAAHCVSERDNEPAIARMGVVNFKNAEQMSEAVEMRIKQIYIHEEYRTRLTYNDIAVIELERDVPYSYKVYPVCLYTDLKDPDPKDKLLVTGWGTVNITTRTFSDLLLKAPLRTAPIERCNKSITEYGLTRRIPEGVRLTQLCAEDREQIKDACQGDSGGPLNLVVDESNKNYKLVGVVSSGFGCASSTPGLYTRVAAYLDFIERVVWPNGAD